MKKIEDYTADELAAKIEAIKAEREKTENALKKYEEELERRKKETPLGVPLNDKTLANHFVLYDLGFTSKKSYRVFDRRFKEYIEALQKLAKGEPIDIKVLLPLLKKGYVAMDKCGSWYWYKDKPEKSFVEWGPARYMAHLSAFNLKPAENWETSLMECGL